VDESLDRPGEGMGAAAMVGYPLYPMQNDHGLEKGRSVDAERRAKLAIKYRSTIALIAARSTLLP
jgi:hypothetical protein